MAGLHGREGEVADGAGREERRRLPRRDHGVFARGEHGGEQAVRHPHPRLAVSLFGDGGDERLCQLGLPTVEAGGADAGDHQQPWPGDLDAGHDVLGSGGDILEGAGVPCLVVREQGDLGARALGLALAHAAAHPGRAGGGAHRDHAAAVLDGGGRVRRQARLSKRGHHGPVGHPQHGTAHRGDRRRRVRGAHGAATRAAHASLSDLWVWRARPG